MSDTQGPAATLEKFDTAMNAYLEALAPVPDESLDYRIPGEDYALGGLAHHVNAVLVHYRNTLRAIIASSFEETAPADPPGLFKTANAKARTGLRPDQRKAVLGETEALHAEVRRIAGSLNSEDFERKAPVRFEAGADPFPTSAADVLGWLTGHYEEHIPQIGQLLAASKSNRVDQTLAAVNSFNDAFGKGDVDGVMAHMTADCVFENTLPPPDGRRYVGQAEVRAFWTSFFADNPTARWETEELFADGDRAVMRWVFHWGEGERSGHVRGVDVYRVAGGKVAEKLSYVKG